MSITIRVKMNNSVQAAVKRAQRGALIKSGAEIERAMKIVLSNPGGPDRTPSMPGTPPNRQRGELRSSVQSALRGDGNGVLAGATARYARIQEKGGVTHPTVTPRMRKWAWAMFYKISTVKHRWAQDFKARMYRAIALTKKASLTIRLPPRPFVKRSLDAALPNIMRHWKGMLQK